MSRAMVRVSSTTISTTPGPPGVVYYRIPRGTILDLGPAIVSSVYRAGEDGVPPSEWVRFSLPAPVAGTRTDETAPGDALQAEPATVPAGFYWIDRRAIDIEPARSLRVERLPGITVTETVIPGPQSFLARTLTRRAGPLPVWKWAAIGAGTVTVGALLVALVRAHGGGGK